MGGRDAVAIRQSGVRSGEPCHTGFVGGWRAVLAMGTLVVGLAACNGPTAPQPPDGGRAIDLDSGFFLAAVEPVLVARDCARTTGCHGGQGAGMLLLSGGADPEADSIAVRSHTPPWDPPTSPFLLKPPALVPLR